MSYDHTVEIPIRGADGVLIRFSFSGQPIEAVAIRYPDGTRIIASDNPEFSKLVEAAVGEERPVAVVMPDGSDIVWRPRDPVAGLGALLLLLGLFLVKRAERRAEERPMFVPEDWVSEFHRARPPSRCSAACDRVKTYAPAQGWRAERAQRPRDRTRPSTREAYCVDDKRASAAPAAHGQRQ